MTYLFEYLYSNTGNSDSIVKLH